MAYRDWDGITSPKFMQIDLSTNTQQSYASDLRHFIKWGGVIPASLDQLLFYLRERASWDSVATIRRRVMAIRHAHIVRDLPTPTDDPNVKVVLRNIARKIGCKQKQAKPLMRRELRKVVRAMGKTTLDLRDKALLLLGFAGAFRRSELVGINIEDVEKVDEGFLIHLRKSKTDQAQHGRIVAIPKMRNALCPVVAVERWLRVAAIEKGAIFQRLTRSGKSRGTRLEGAYVSVVLKTRLEAVGINANQYSAHSLRAGLITEAAKSGVPTWKIRQTSGHKSEEMVSRYIRDVDLFTGHAAAAACRR